MSGVGMVKGGHPLRPAITLKQPRPEDREVLFELYAALRGAELRLEDWAPAAREQILRLQFEARSRGYREQFPAAEERLILREGEPIGWLIVERSRSALHCIDIALLATERSKGVGTQMIGELQAEAAAAGRPMIISVQRFNERAQSLYRRLGFRPTAETPLQITMEWMQE